MGNRPPDTGGAGSNPDWDMFGALPFAEDLEYDPVYQPAPEYTNNPAHMGPPHINPPHPSQVRVGNHVSPMRPRDWQSMTGPGGQNTGTNPYTTPHPVNQQGTNPPFRGRSSAAAGYSGRTFERNTNHFGLQTSSQVLVPDGSDVNQQQHPDTPMPPMMHAPGRLPAGPPVPWQPYWDLPVNIQVPQPSFPPQYPVGPGYSGDNMTQFPGRQIPQSQLPQNIMPPVTPSPRRVVEPATSPERPTPTSSEKPTALSSERPTPEVVRARVRFSAPTSDPHERFSADHPIPEMVVEMGKGWDSGLNHFAKFGDEDEPQLKYRMKLGRGRKPSGGRQGNAYSQNHPAPAELLPARLRLTSFMQDYPNHAWGQGIRLLMAEGIKPEELWHHLPKEVRHDACPKRPWNYLQHTYGRETNKMIYEETGVKPVPKPRSKRPRPLDDDDREGSNKKQKPTPTDPAPTPRGVPMVADCPPPQVGTDLMNLTLRQRWQYTAPHQWDVEDYRAKWGHKRAICKEVMRRVLMKKDPEFEGRSIDFQMRHLDNAMDLLSARHAQNIRTNNLLRPTQYGRYNSDQFFWATRALSKSSEYGQQPGESDEEFKNRVSLIAWRGMLGWIEDKIDDFRRELDDDPIAANDSDYESEEDESEGDEAEE